MNTIDCHAHIGQSIFGYGQEPEELLRQMDHLGIAQSVICPVQPLDYHLGPENERVAAAVQRWPERLVGFCRVDPRQGTRAIAELQRCIHSLGLRGLFLHPWEETGPINAPEVKQLVQAALPLQIPVMLSGGHVRVSRAVQIAELVRDFPTIPFIITSGGQLNISGVALQEAEQLLSEFEHLWLETSGIYREDFIEDMAAKLGAHRLLFGSNSPQYDLRLEVLRPRLSHLGAVQKSAILGENARKLLQLPPALVP